jgi:hypothetical protein
MPEHVEAVMRLWAADANAMEAVVDFLSAGLAIQREENDELPMDSIQAGQGKAVALKEILRFLRGPSE